jgi:hypothetical protein
MKLPRALNSHSDRPQGELAPSQASLPKPTRKGTLESSADPYCAFQVLCILVPT